MALYRIDKIAELARQMAFTPAHLRASQLQAAEDLLASVDPAKPYPFDYVVFRITGYRPAAGSDTMLAGLALRHDLGSLIEDVSDTLDLQTDQTSEPVLSIDDVTERFNVTSKTIQRWRRKGLVARRFNFPDGKKRVGFLLSSVERFVSTHSEQVERGANFSQVSDSERVEIIRRARRLATECHCCQKEICRRIARKLNRSPLTILHTIRKHDTENADNAIFPLARPEIAEPQRTRILKAARKGLRLRVLSNKTRQTRSAVYRVIIEERIAKLNARRIKFIDDAIYHGDDAESILSGLLNQGELGSGESETAVAPSQLSRAARDLPPYLAELYRTPLLTPARERALFLIFNYHKFRFVQARRRLEPEFAKARHIDELEAHLKNATAIKNQIVAANLRLVVNIARRHLRPGLELMELISDGNVTLMRAIESFDTHKGYRFSTYATLALMKGFARSTGEMLAKKRSSIASTPRGAAAATTTSDERVLTGLSDTRSGSALAGLADREQVMSLLAKLDDRERRVLMWKFGLDGQAEARGSADNRGGPPRRQGVDTPAGISLALARRLEASALTKLRALVQAPKTNHTP